MGTAQVYLCWVSVRHFNVSATRLAGEGKFGTGGPLQFKS